MAISKFEIIGAYFVNLFYNEFYKQAVNIKLSGDATGGTQDSTTDIYKSILTAYTDFVNKPEFFKQTVRGVHTYCISTTNNSTMDHRECVEWLVSEFVPEKIWASLREKQKNKLFHEIIGGCVCLFIRKIISQHLVMIIDNHAQENNIMIMQNVFLDIICIEKEKVYAKFLSPKVSGSVPMVVYKTKISELDAKTKRLDELTNTMTALKQFAEKASKELKKTMIENKRLQDENKKLKQYVNELATHKTPVSPVSVVRKQSDTDVIRGTTQTDKPVSISFVKPPNQKNKPDKTEDSHPICLNDVMGSKAKPNTDTEKASRDDEDGTLLFADSDDFYDDDNDAED